MIARERGLRLDPGAEPLRVGGAALQQPGHLVDPVDEGEHAHLAELVVQRLHQQHREVRETGDRPRHIAQEHQFGAGRSPSAQHRLHRHSAGRQRSAQGATQIDRASRGPAATCHEPGCQLAGQRLNGPAELGQLGLPGEQEVDPVCGRSHRPPGDLVAPAPLGDPAPRLRGHQPAEGLDAPPDLVLQQPVREPRTRAPPTDVVAHPGQQRLRAQPLQRLVRRPAVRLRRGSVAAEPVHRLHREAAHHRPVVGRQRRRQPVPQVVPPRGLLVGAADAAREVQVEDRVEHRPLPGAVQQRRRQPLAQQLPVREAERLDGLRRVHGLAGADPDAVRAQRADQGRQPLRDARRRGHRASRSSFAVALRTSS
ncbi:hypothetical protein SCHAM137S_06551 [Streptomyces chartreusis]